MALSKGATLVQEAMEMSVLVGYASKHGATGEVTDRTTVEPREIPGFLEAIRPRDHHVFFGALNPGRLTFAEKTLPKLATTRAMMPEGDIRDRTEIEVWARSIAEKLTQLDAAHVQEDP
jgi:hypothetical protein